MPVTLFDAAEHIVQTLRDRLSPGVGAHIWTEIVSDIGRNRSLNGRYCKIIEDEINKYIDGLSENDQRNIWKETEVAEWNRGEADEYYIDSISMDLEVALFVEVTKWAWEEAERVHREKAGER